MTATQPSLSLASSPNALTLSREIQEGKQESITIPLADIDAICEVLRQAKQAMLSQNPHAMNDASAEALVPPAESLPESMAAAFATNEEDLLAPVDEEIAAEDLSEMN